MISKQLQKIVASNLAELPAITRWLNAFGCTKPDNYPNIFDKLYLPSWKKYVELHPFSNLKANAQLLQQILGFQTFMASIKVNPLLPGHKVVPNKVYANVVASWVTLAHEQLKRTVQKYRLTDDLRIVKGKTEVKIIQRQLVVTGYQVWTSKSAKNDKLAAVLMNEALKRLKGRLYNRSTIPSQLTQNLSASKLQNLSTNQMLLVSSQGHVQVWAGANATQLYLRYTYSRPIEFNWLNGQQALRVARKQLKALPKL